MGSVFTTVPGNTIKGSFGKETDVPIYLQFVPGCVVEVVHSEQNPKSGGANTINSIIALPHISDKPFKRRSSIGGEDHRYFPLLRTMHDVPSKGDPVLLCTFGNCRYYLGPLNTQNNSPTWNNDPQFRLEQLIGADVPIKGRGIKGESPNFNKKWSWKRLVKVRKEGLDYGNALVDVTGDTIIEGRHGNSLRIGSRSASPYIFISNGRNENQNVESIVDGTLISITAYGSLKQHFGTYGNNEEFILASDRTPENKRTMGTMIGSINHVEDPYSTIYAYGHISNPGSQFFLSSDRIMMNTRKDDIYLSSKKDIHIGTGRHLTISTNKNLIIESEKTYLGDPNKADNKDDEDKSLMEPMVLGKTLLEILKELTGVLKEAHGLVQGVGVPLVDGPTPKALPLASKIETIGGKLDTILSQHHFVEPNKGKK